MQCDAINLVPSKKGKKREKHFENIQNVFTWWWRRKEKVRFAKDGTVSLCCEIALAKGISAFRSIIKSRKRSTTWQNFFLFYPLGTICILFLPVYVVVVFWFLCCRNVLHENVCLREKERKEIRLNRPDTNIRA